MTLDKELEKWLEGAKKIVILGIGSSIRGDDAVGLEVVKKLQGKVPSFVEVLEGETAPDSFAELIAKFRPTHVVMVNAAELDLKPGEIRLIPMKEFSGHPVLSHDLPLYLLSEYLEQTIHAKSIIFAIQPRSMDIGTELTPELKKAVEKIVNLFVRILSKIER